MVRYFFIWILITTVSSLGAQGTQEQPQTGGRLIRLINQTGTTLSNLRISPTGSQDWGQDVLKGEDFEDSDEKLVQLTDVPGPWDLLVDNGEGEREEITSLPLAAEKTWIIVRRLGHLNLERGPSKRRRHPTLRRIRSTGAEGFRV